MLKHIGNSVYNLTYHLVFVTKYRQAIFNTNERRESMKAFIRNICQQRNVEIIQLEVMPEHVHLLISFPPKLAPANVVKAVKGIIARDWFKQYPDTKNQLWDGHLWSPSYFIASTGNVSQEIIANYVKNQMKKLIKK